MTKNFFIVLGVPFVLSQWMPFNIEIKGSPEIKVVQSSLRIMTHGDAGGYAYFFNEPLRMSDGLTQMSWKWKVDQFPNTMPKVPYTKKNEDFALRVGFLFSDGKARIPLPGKLRREFRKRKETLSYVLFYCAVPGKALKDGGRTCGKSPFHNSIVNCMRKATAESLEEITVNPFKDIQAKFKLNSRQMKRLKIVGVWLFADSDNSKSMSQADIADIQFILKKPPSS